MEVTTWHWYSADEHLSIWRTMSNVHPFLVLQLLLTSRSIEYKVILTLHHVYFVDVTSISLASFLPYIIVSLHLCFLSVHAGHDVAMWWWQLRVVLHVPKTLFASVGVKDLARKLISWDNTVLVMHLRTVDLRQLQSWFALVSNHALRNILASQMRLVTLLHWLSVLIKNVVWYFLLWSFLVKHVSGSLSLLLHVRVDIDQFERFFLRLRNVWPTNNS